MSRPNHTPTLVKASRLFARKYAEDVTVKDEVVVVYIPV